MDIPPCHPSGECDFVLVPGFLEKLCAPLLVRFLFFIFFFVFRTVTVPFKDPVNLLKLYSVGGRIMNEFGTAVE